MTRVLAFGFDALPQWSAGFYVPRMSTVQEIEQAVERLSNDDLRRVEAVLRRVQQRQYTAGKLGAIERTNGFDVLPQRPGPRATAEDVHELCAEAGI
jgi:hypothetical protein